MKKKYNTTYWILQFEQKQFWKFIATNTYIKKLDLKEANFILQGTTKKCNKLSPKLAEGRNYKDQHRNERESRKTMGKDQWK